MPVIGFEQVNFGSADKPHNWDFNSSRTEPKMFLGSRLLTSNPTLMASAFVRTNPAGELIRTLSKENQDFRKTFRSINPYFLGPTKGCYGSIYVPVLGV